MISRDHFYCNYCKYEWCTRKDVGKPSICPNCKEQNIINKDEEERTKQREATQRKSKGKSERRK